MGNANAIVVVERSPAEELDRTPIEIQLGNGETETIDGILDDTELALHMEFDEDIQAIYLKYDKRLKGNQNQVERNTKQLESAYQVDDINQVEGVNLPIPMVASHRQTYPDQTEGKTDIEVLRDALSTFIENGENGTVADRAELQAEITTALMTVEQEFVDLCQQIIDGGPNLKAEIEAALKKQEEAFQAIEAFQAQNKEFLDKMQAFGMVDQSFLESVGRNSGFEYLQQLANGKINWRYINELFAQDLSRYGVIGPSDIVYDDKDGNPTDAISSQSDPTLANYTNATVDLEELGMVPLQTLVPRLAELAKLLENAETAGKEIPKPFQYYLNIKQGKKHETGRELFVRVRNAMISFIAIEVGTTIAIAFVTGGVGGVAKLFVSTGRAVKSMASYSRKFALATNKAELSAQYARTIGVRSLDSLAGEFLVLNPSEIREISSSAYLWALKWRRGGRIRPQKGASVQAEAPKSVSVRCKHGVCSR